MAIIGIDIGNVIIGGGGEDTNFFTEGYLTTPAIWGSFDAIKALVNEGHEIVIISKCGMKTMLKSISWLQYHEFFEYTGVSIDSLNFVKTREEKAPLAESLGVEIMIDDRIDIIESMAGKVKLPILFETWDTVLEVIREYDTQELCTR